MDLSTLMTKMCLIFYKATVLENGKIEITGWGFYNWDNWIICLSWTVHVVFGDPSFLEWHV